MAANSKEQSAEQIEVARKASASKILFSFFWSIFGSCIVLQSDAQLFTAACGGDPGATARAFGIVSGATGIISLFVNQAGGKLSDSTGRKPLFLLGPIVPIICNLEVFRYSTCRCSWCHGGQGDAARLQHLLRHHDEHGGLDGYLHADGDGPARRQARDRGGRRGCPRPGEPRTAPVLAPCLILSRRGPSSGRMFSQRCAANPPPQIVEVALIKPLGGNGERHFLVSAMMSAIQLVFQLPLLPATLGVEKRRSLSEFFGAVSSINPLSFLTVFRGKNRPLKQLLMINTLQCSAEGRCTSECFQLWGELDISATQEMVRNMLRYWGVTVSGFGIVGSPFLLKKLSVKNYTTLTNMSVLIGFFIKGWSSE